jgi:hypothetical protein
MSQFNFNNAEESTNGLEQIIDARLDTFIRETPEFPSLNEAQHIISSFINSVMSEIGANVADSYYMVFWSQPLGDSLYFNEIEILKVANGSGRGAITWNKSEFKQAMLSYVSVAA